MKRETQEWVKIAEEDLESAECLFAKGLYRMVCYHAQQAVEKFPKATLESTTFLTFFLFSRGKSVILRLVTKKLFFSE